MARGCGIAAPDTRPVLTGRRAGQLTGLAVMGLCTAVTALEAPAFIPAPAAPAWVPGCRATQPVAAAVQPLPATPVPAVVTGRVAFHAFLATPGKGVQRSISLGDVDAVFPLASAFKPLVVRGILRDVDAGRLKLTKKLATTEANRSIESYPKGSNNVRELARRAIALSDNTASDILHLAYGPERLAREVRAKWPCTAILNTTKAWWAAQAGLLGTALGPDTLGALRTAAAAPFDERLRTAARLIAASQQVRAPALEQTLDDYFHGPTYTPELELYVQPTSTAREFTQVSLQAYSATDLKPATRAAFRSMMQTGCCRPKTPSLATTYWGAKAGSGWRILTLTGAVDLPDGRSLAYTYLNDQSTVTDAEDMELQIRPVVTWIETQLITLAGAP